MWKCGVRIKSNSEKNLSLKRLVTIFDMVILISYILVDEGIRYWQIFL